MQIPLRWYAGFHKLRVSHVSALQDLWSLLWIFQRYRCPDHQERWYPVLPEEERAHGCIPDVSGCTESQQDCVLLYCLWWWSWRLPVLPVHTHRRVCRYPKRSRSLFCPWQLQTDPWFRSCIRWSCSQSTVRSVRCRSCLRHQIRRDLLRLLRSELPGMRKRTNRNRSEYFRRSQDPFHSLQSILFLLMPRELQADSLPSCIPACWSDRQEWQWSHRDDPDS